MTGRKEAGGEERLSFQLYVAWEDEEGTESEGGQEGLERRPPDEAAAIPPPSHEVVWFEESLLSVRIDAR